MEHTKDNQEAMAIQHPLENQVILDLVFAYCQPLATFEDWKNIRLVCKTWYFQTLVNWRATAFLNLKLGPTRYQYQPQGPGVSMSELLTIIENDHGDFSQFTDKPFQNYKLQNLVLDVFTVNNNNLFWTLVGPNIKHLSLDQVNINTYTKTMTEVMEFFVNQMPNLKSFALSNVYIEGMMMNKPPIGIPMVHMNVKTLSISHCFAFGFANFPNLKEVTLKSSGSKDLANLMESNDVHINSSIERLTLDTCNIDALYFPRLQFTALKHLSVDRDRVIRRTCVDVIALSDFIENHTSTLETIEAFGSLTDAFISLFDMISSSLPNLTELRASGNVFLNFGFIRYTPNLKLLHLDCYGLEKHEKTREDFSTGLVDQHWYLPKRDLIRLLTAAGGNVQTPLLQLHYLQINQELEKRSLESLAKWMPNLKTLKTVLNADTLPVVCEKWPELEHLECLFGSRILNENITGITGIESSSNTAYASYRRALKNLDCLTTSKLQNITGIDEGALDGQRSRALMDMECLTTFKLHTECNQGLLTDESVDNGFLRVSKLTDLSICVSPEFTEEAEILLRRGIRNVQVYRNYSSNPLHNNWQCCRDTEYKSFVISQLEPPRSSN